MATYESLIEITGSVGDLVFYRLNGKNVVRKKSGFNKKAFKKSPSYEKVRQNSSEFGHCSKSGKLIRNCIDRYIKESGDPLLYQSFARLMTDIKDLDVLSERGKRSVTNGLATEKGKQLLKAFQFGNKEIIPLETQVIAKSDQIVLAIASKNDIREIILVTIKPDFDHYTVDYFEERKIISGDKKTDFKNHFPDIDAILYFVVFRDKAGEIVGMGFV
jgi:hypothetical protein